MRQSKGSVPEEYGYFMFGLGGVAVLVLGILFSPSLLGTVMLVFAIPWTTWTLGTGLRIVGCAVADDGSIRTTRERLRRVAIALGVLLVIAVLVTMPFLEILLSE